MAGITSSSRLPAPEGGLVLTFRPAVTPPATQFLDRMGAGSLAPVHAVPKDQRSRGHYTNRWANSTRPNPRPEAHAVELDDNYLDNIAAGFGQVNDAKSPYNSGPSVRVADYADMIAQGMGMPEERKAG